MDILVATSAFLPAPGVSAWGTAKGEAATIAHGIARGLKALGHRTTIVAPLDASVVEWGLGLARRLSPVAFELATPGSAKRTRVERTIHDVRLPTGVEVSLLGGDSPNETDDPLEAALRGAWFAHAVAAYARQRFVVAASRAPGDPELEAVVAVGEGAGLVSLALREAGRGASLAFSAEKSDHSDGPSLKVLAGLSRLSVPIDPHADITCDRASLGRAGVSDGLFTPEGVEFYGRLSFAKAAAIAADRIVVLGDAPRDALTTVGAAHRLEGVYRARSRDIVSIGSGLDPSQFNAAIDPHLPARFDAEDLSGKTRCKSTFIAEQELDRAPNLPLLVAVAGGASTLTSEVVVALERALRGEVLVAIAIARAETGSAADLALHKLERQHPGRVRVRFSASAATLHRALGAADLALVLDCDGASGAAARAPMRYGAIPVARNTPSMREAIVDADAALATGTGVLFDTADEDATFAALQRALSAYGTPAFRKLQRRVMRTEGGWERAARRLESLIQQLEA